MVKKFRMSDRKKIIDDDSSDEDVAENIVIEIVNFG